MVESQTESAEADLESRVAEDRLDERPREKREEERHSNKSNLDKKSSSRSIENDDISFTLNEDGKLVPEYNGKRVYGEGAIMPSRLIPTRNADKREQPADTYDGAVAILYHIDSEGNIWFSFEQKPENHPRAGKYALYGGTVRVDENHLAAAERELQEEDPKAYSMIIKALNDTRHKFTEVLENIDGVSSRTSIWIAGIKDPLDWEKYKSTKTTEGYKTILSLEDTIATIQKNNFAYPQQGKAVRDFIEVMLNSPKFYSTGLQLSYTPTYKPANLSSIIHNIN